MLHPGRRTPKRHMVGTVSNLALWLARFSCRHRNLPLPVVAVALGYHGDQTRRTAVCVAHNCLRILHYKKAKSSLWCFNRWKKRLTSHVTTPGYIIWCYAQFCLMRDATRGSAQSLSEFYQTNDFVFKLPVKQHRLNDADFSPRNKSVGFVVFSEITFCAGLNVCKL